MHKAKVSKVEKLLNLISLRNKMHDLNYISLRIDDALAFHYPKLLYMTL
jgi:hypothetical protein